MLQNLFLDKATSRLKIAKKPIGQRCSPRQITLIVVSATPELKLPGEMQLSRFLHRRCVCSKLGLELCGPTAYWLVLEAMSIIYIVAAIFYVCEIPG